MQNSAIETNLASNKTMGQVGRFVIVGLINTAIDFIVLNLLSKLTHIGIHDSKIIYLNIISFSCATTNSYFMNKYWSFGDHSQNRSQQFTIFLMVSIAGALINSSVLKGSATLFPGFLASIAHLVTIILPLSIWNNIDLTLNLAKVLATAVSLIWNFVGYKLFVFKK